jgi:hypothetical protein
MTGAEAAMQNLSQEPANTVCPVCGAAVDPAIAPVIAPHASEAGDAILRIGVCCDECRCLVADEPEFYFAAAAENAVAVGG